MKYFLTTLVPLWDTSKTQEILKAFDTIPGLSLVKDREKFQRFEFDKLPTEPLAGVYQKYSRESFFNPLLSCFRKVGGIVSLYSGEDECIYKNALEVKIELRKRLDTSIPLTFYPSGDLADSGLHLHVIYASKNLDGVFREINAWDLVLKLKFGARWLELLNESKARRV